jgi:predicted Fe-Mo cluster-binding NifX family protein
MKIAIPKWQDRVSPVFDVAVNLLLIEIENGKEVRREERTLHGTEPLTRINEFLGFGVQTLICGAISAPLAAKLTASGVKVIGFTCGSVEDVLTSYVNGGLSGLTFLMPGCQNGRRRM